MRIVVVGASGLIGAKTVERLRKQGHDIVPASRKSGVNTITGEGLQEAIKGADVVLDVSNAPSWEDKEVMEFFEVSTKNLLAAGGEAGVKHHIALGVVGTDRLQDSGYFRAKQVQEKLIKSGKIPYTIVHATQFFEFLGGIADAATVGSTTNLSTGHMQPIAADDVADVMASTCAQTPVNTTIEIAGPDRLPQNELVARYLKATGDSRQITAAADAPYYGVILDEHKLVPGPGGKICPTSLDEWLKTKAPAVKH
ncbi:MAG: SDR family oxidoreductase [Candidatus Obscuribacterales bacterium]